MIYFIQDNDFGRIKIGYSDDVWVRLSQIQCHSPSKVHILAVEDGAQERERELHSQFARFRSHGEWFSGAPDLMTYIETLDAPPKRQSSSQTFWGGLKGTEVAEITGISQGFISRIQAGKRVASPEVAIKLQRATGVSAIKLVFGDLASEAA